jgi:nitroreductase
MADLLDVMRTTFAAREFTDAPVPDDALARILDDARFAPSGGNRQGWRVIVVREPATKRALAELATPTMRRYVAQVAAGESPWNTVVPTKLTPAQIDATPVPARLLDAFAKAPVLLVVCVDLAVLASFDSQLARVGVISGASVYPFVWNLLLAANAEGFGGTLTTFCTGAEPEVQKLLGVPAQFAVAAVLPIGVPARRLTQLRRKPVHAFATRERFDGDAFAAPLDEAAQAALARDRVVDITTRGRKSGAPRRTEIWFWRVGGPLSDGGAGSRPAVVPQPPGGAALHPAPEGVARPRPARIRSPDRQPRRTPPRARAHPRPDRRQRAGRVGAERPAGWTRSPARQPRADRGESRRGASALGGREPARRDPPVGFPAAEGARARRGRRGGSVAARIPAPRLRAPSPMSLSASAASVLRALRSGHSSP